MIPYIDTLPPAARTIGTIVVSSLVASGYYWATQRAGTDNPESFKPQKAAVTMGVAFVLSLILYGTGTVTGFDALLPHLSVGVGPIALWIQQGIKQYRRTGHITIVNGETEDAAEAFADALGISAADLFALADVATAHGLNADPDADWRFDQLATNAPQEDDTTPASTPAPHTQSATIDEPKQPPTPATDPAPASTPTDQAHSVIEMADYRTLQQVAGRFDDVDGSGRRGREAFYEQLREVAVDRPQEFLNAYDSVVDDG